VPVTGDNDVGPAQSRRTARLASEGRRSPQKPSQAAGRGNQLRVGARWAGNGLVFPSGHSTPLDPWNVANKHFKPVLRRAGLPDIQLTLDRGSHWIPSIGRATADGMDEALEYRIDKRFSEEAAARSLSPVRRVYIYHNGDQNRSQGGPS
jgi:hypothetical protein